MRDVFIPKQSNFELLFPIQVDYVASKDKHLDTLFYMATKCGLLAEPKSQLKIKYTVNVSVKVVAVSVDLPPFDNDVNIDCPIPVSPRICSANNLAWDKNPWPTVSGSGSRPDRPQQQCKPSREPEGPHQPSPARPDDRGRQGDRQQSQAQRKHNLTAW